MADTPVSESTGGSEPFVAHASPASPASAETANSPDSTPAAASEASERPTAEAPSPGGPVGRGEEKWRRAFKKGPLPPPETAPTASDAGQQGEAKPEPVRKPSRPPTGRALLRMLDEDIDAELDAALGSFDAEATLKPTEEQAKGAPTAIPTSGPAAREKKAFRVLAVRGADVFVDVGQRAEGIVPAIQFGGKLPQPGDLVELIVDRFDRDNDLFVLRKPGAAQEADWGSIEKGMVVDAVVRKVNKGGLEVTVNGIRGFMPAGQVDLEHIADFGPLLNQTLRCEVTEANLSSRNLVVSRKAFLLKEREEKAKTTWASLAEGQVREGVVRRIADFGAFIDLGGVDGLAHVSQMSWQRVRHPGDVLMVGQPVKVTVLKIDPETKRISLSLKDLAENPWSRAEEKYRPGAILTGVVTKLMEFGVFVEVEPGIEGLVHVSEWSNQRVRRLADVAKPDQEVTVKVLAFDREKQRISLSVKQAIVADEPEAPEAAPETEATADAALASAKPKRPAASLKGGLGGSGGPLFG